MYCSAPPVTVEHMPPTGMFRERRRLSGLEFACCRECNFGTRAADAVAAFMALSRLDELALRLLAAGRDPATPVAIVSQASLPGQAVLRTTLGACTLAAKRAALPTPALVVIGEVAGLALRLPAPDIREAARHA